jgi:urease subunit alpha
VKGVVKIARRDYAAMYGPTVGDGIRLADTSLVAVVEQDHAVYGDECLHGGGKTLRDGIGLAAGVTSAGGALDLLLCNVTVIDPVLGIVKGDLGIAGGRIVGLGKAGNPAIMDGVDPRLLVSAATTVRDCEGLIATPGGIDVHVHFDSAGLCEHAIASGITTMLGGSLGPITVGIDSGGPFNVGKMLQAAEHWPINFGFLGRGNSHLPAPLVEQMETGCVGLKIHEDWGSMPATIDACLKVADELDFQVQLHTDTLNESGFVEDTLAAIGGRTIHMYHTEGAGGGHAPDIIRVAGVANCLPSSTNPTNPYTVNTFDEHLDMTMVCHHLNPAIPEDVAFAESRIRAQTIAAEDVLHDIGAISMLGSDSQGMGRIHEVICRTWQLASKMKDQRGALPEDRPGFGDNARIRRYIAKYTINAARTFGIAEHVGSLEDGKMADVVVWRPAFFGIKPELVIKGGFIAWGAMGDSAASLMTCEPILLRPQWGAFGRAAAALSACFVHPLAIAGGLAAQLGLSKSLLPARHTRRLGKADMLWNAACPAIRVDPQTFDVFVDGALATCAPARELPLAQRYMLR